MGREMPRDIQLSWEKQHCCPSGQFLVTRTNTQPILEHLTKEYRDREGQPRADYQDFSTFCCLCFLPRAHRNAPTFITLSIPYRHFKSYFTIFFIFIF